MPRIPAIPVEAISQLPLMSRATIGAQHLDLMGHMNVRHYLGLFDDAAWTFFESFGMTAEYYRENNTGGFALEQHIRYLAEVREGETVAIYARIIARNAKRVHFMYFMVNEDKQTLSATLEGVGSHADLSIRRTSPYPDFILQRLDALLDEQKALTWEAPICGFISV
ncbi:MAG: thioesterase [Anaerolineaceae bacterium]|nr:MAG: thioesterase [Anaerolineaceae bacterium]